MAKHSDVGASAFVRGSIPNKVREDNDFHQTPPIATRALLDREEFPGVVWECACGAGAMSDVLVARSKNRRLSRVVSTDLVDRGYGSGGIDFLTHVPKFTFDYIVTNPPYTYTSEFAQRALNHRPKKVALLARLSWLEGKKRKEFFETSGLTRVLVFSSRINMPRESVRKDYGESGRGGMVAYAWFVWHRGHVGPATLGWL